MNAEIGHHASIVLVVVRDICQKHVQASGTSAAIRNLASGSLGLVIGLRATDACRIEGSQELSPRSGAGAGSADGRATAKGHLAISELGRRNVVQRFCECSNRCGRAISKERVGSDPSGLKQ